MKRERIRVALTLILIFSLCLLGVESIAAENEYKMGGEITAIEKDYNTVVIEVLLGNDRLFTVGGPLSEGAVLKKDGQTVSLSSFAVGDKVTVLWRATEKGHIIDRLETR